MIGGETLKPDPAKPCKGRLRRLALRRAPEGVDVFEFGEPPRIENWRLVTGFGGAAQTLIGQIYDHPLRGDMECAYTSRVIWISLKSGFARTWSRYYRLGKQAPRIRKRAGSPKSRKA
jgi:hypothetical protein